MTPRDADAAAPERRADLAALFCAVARHGPAVALALVAVVCAVAAAVIYRSVKGKRRRTTAAAGASEVRPGREASPVEAHGSTESTDVSDHDLKIRRRPATAAATAVKDPRPYSPPRSHIHVPDAEAMVEEAAHDLTREEVAVDGDSCTVHSVEETIEDVYDNDHCLKAPEQIHDEIHEPEEKVFIAADQKGERTSRNQDVSEESSRVNLNQTPHMSDMAIHDRRQDNEAARGTNNMESNMEEPLVHTEGVSVTCNGYGRDKGLAKENHHPDNTEDRGNFFAGEEIRNEGEEQFVPQQDETCPLTSGQEHAAVWKPQISGHMGVWDDSLTGRQQPQSERKDEELAAGLDKDKDQSMQTSDNKALEKSIDEPVTSDVTSHPKMLPLSQDQETDQMQTEDVYVVTQDLNLHVCQIALPTFEQREMRDDVGSGSSPGVGEESGISSMAVSPDLQGTDFVQTIETMLHLRLECDLLSDERMQVQNGPFADDIDVSISNEGAAGTTSRPYPSHVPQQPHSETTDGAKYESLATNEDIFGNEIENSYHRALEQFMVELAANAFSSTYELKNQTTVEVHKMKEKMEGVIVVKNMESEAEKGEEEDDEKTDISIMEATMDNNEWITDSNYQVPPWMNLSVPSFKTKAHQPPNEDRHQSSSITYANSMDTGTAPSPAVKPTTVDENDKKVVAVQPMPQSVNVTFSIHYLTRSPYQMVAVTGNQQELGNWKEFIPLEGAKDGLWSTVVSLPAESHVEWKFVLVDKGEVCRWEECGNRLLDTGSGEDLTVHKLWGLL